MSISKVIGPIAPQAGEHLKVVLDNNTEIIFDWRPDSSDSTKIEFVATALNEDGDWFYRRLEAHRATELKCKKVVKKWVDFFLYILDHPEVMYPPHDPLSH